ncbi:MAG: cytochrome c biogenesis protein CcsA [Deltaproteobacteria bacterium]|nr:cytochrome c biogenesis protein CcsA [Deltaproteobacteria bacterium]
MSALFDSPRAEKTPPALLGLAVLAAVLVPYSAWRIFFQTPEEEVMGFVQKIFYFHVPSAMNMFLAIVIAAVGSIGYLLKQTDFFDNLEDSAVDLAILFGAAVLISGPLWGRKAWGAYWVWDVRLTSTLVLFLTLLATKIVRTYAGPAAKQITAGLTLFAVVNSLFVYVCVRIWKTTHPGPIIGPDGGGLDAAMRTTFNISWLALTLAFVALLWMRLRLGALRTGVDRLHHLATEAGLDE